MTRLDFLKKLCLLPAALVAMSPVPPAPFVPQSHIHPYFDVVEQDYETEEVGDPPHRHTFRVIHDWRWTGTEKPYQRPPT